VSAKISRLVEAFLEFKRHNRGRSQRTIELYRLALSRFETFLAGRDPLAVSFDDLMLFAGLWLHKQGVNPVNRRTHVSALREFYRWLSDTHRLPTNLALSVPYPTIGRTLPRVMTLASAEKLMWAPDFNTFEGVRDGAMLALLVGCGLRVSGLVALNAGDVLEDVIDGKPRLKLRVTEKRSRVRYVPVPLDAELMLRVYLGHPNLASIDRALPSGDQVLFVSLRNPRCPPHEYRGERRRLSRIAVGTMVMKYGKREGIPEAQLHPHAMRHLYGTELAEDSVDLELRQKLMGHADPKSTEIYSHLAMRHLTREADRANPLAKIRTPVSDILKRLKP